MINLINISKKYNNKLIFEGLNLKINDGEFVCITGKSGSGKSTLLNIIGGLDIDFEGTLEFDNVCYSRSKIFNVTSYLFQNFALLEEESVEYNLKIFKNKASVEEMMKSLESVNLGSYHLKQYVFTLSGGEKQRVALARVLLSNKNILLCDEPTASLDEENRNYIFSTLKKLNEKTNKTIIIVSHDKWVIERCDRIIYL